MDPSLNLLFSIFVSFFEDLGFFSWLIFYMLNFVEYVPIVSFIRCLYPLYFLEVKNEEAPSDSN